ncbi:hypothetical protein [Nocardia carnea]|uniref:hypothetical protein n=1 Tax=Nocardia carnea TaxID=37328 RepID=UPI002455EFE8|nr:hypothetical protein [Nocardia carnea]
MVSDRIPVPVHFVFTEPLRDSDPVTAVFIDKSVRGGFIAYAHVGQHTWVHEQWVKEQRPATPEEYAPLLAELRSMGYTVEIASSPHPSCWVRVTRYWEPNPPLRPLPSDTTIQVIEWPCSAATAYRQRADRHKWAGGKFERPGGRVLTWTEQVYSDPLYKHRPVTVHVTFEVFETDPRESGETTGVVPELVLG